MTKQQIILALYRALRRYANSVPNVDHRLGDGTAVCKDCGCLYPITTDPDVANPERHKPDCRWAMAVKLCDGTEVQQIVRAALADEDRQDYPDEYKGDKWVGTSGV